MSDDGIEGLGDEAPAEEGSPPWMATFADLSTLLLTFFVLLLSMATMDMAKYKDLLYSVHKAFGAKEIHEGSFQTLSTTPVRISDTESSTSIKIQELNLRSRDKAVKTQMLSRLRGFVSDTNLEKVVEAKAEQGGIRVRVQGDLLFDAGSAELRPEALVLLREFIDLTRQYPWDLAIEGHTDDLPTDSRRFESNWDLSAARAIAALRFMLEAGDVDPGRLSVAGFADVRPLVPNDSPGHRSRNRRVEFLFHDGGRGDPAPEGEAPQTPPAQLTP